MAGRIIGLSLGHPLDNYIFESIEARLKETHPGVTFKTFDLLSYVKPTLKDMIWDRLSTVADYLPGSMIDLGALLEPDLESMVGQLAHDRLSDDLHAEQADVLLGVHPLTQQAMSGLSQRVLRDTAMVTLIPEYKVDHKWVRARSDLYLVASGDLREGLADIGVPMAQSAAVGLPLAKDHKPVDRAALREKFKIGSKKLVLVLARELDEAVMEKMLFQFSLVNSEVVYIMATEGDTRTGRFLRDRSPNYSVKARLYHKQDKLSALCAAADVVIGRPNPLRVAEILSRGVPVIMLQADNEREKATAEVLAAENAGKAIDNGHTLAAELDSLLQSPQQTEQLRRGALALARPNASKEIAERLARAAGDEKEKLIARRIEQGHSRRPSAPPPEDGFEDIGEFDFEPASEPQWSQQERHEHLAQAIRHEKVLARRLTEQKALLKKWNHRGKLAKQNNRADLMHEVRVRVETYRRTIAFLEKELDVAKKSREQIKGGGTASSPYTRSPFNWQSNKEEELERDFRSMEVESDLDALKRKLDD